MKQGIIAALVAALTVTPVFGSGGGSGSDPEEKAGAQIVSETTVNMDDPEFNKYYRYDENGNLVKKNSSEPYDLYRVTASGNYIHPERYADRTIYDCIDVSAHQGNINWTKVKNDGITHAIIRVAFRGQSSGDLYEDNYYKKNIQEAAAEGIKVGVYIYSQALTKAEARAEADYIMDCIEPYKSMITMPVVFDYEFGISKEDGGRFYAGCISKAQMTKNCVAFCERVKKAGYEPMVYANANMLINYLDRDALSSDYKIWLAHYTRSTGYAGDFYMWQYTSSGSVNGISGNVDMNFIYEEASGEWVADETNGEYRFLKGDGTYAESEWVIYGENKYYVDENGHRLTGYHEIGGYGYGFNAKGVMLTGLKKIDGEQYRFAADGKAILYTAKLTKAAGYRTGPGTGYGKKGQYGKGLVVNIVREENGWGMMKNGYWVKLSYTKKVTEYPHAVQSSYKVQTNTALNYRTGPGTSYKKAGTYKKWKIVTIVSKENGWGKMKNGYWIKLSYTKRV